MPRYHFNIRDGEQLIPDEEGMMCEDLEAARFEARASARDLLAQEIRHGIEPDGRAIEITERGQIVETIALRDVMYDYGGKAPD